MSLDLGVASRGRILIEGTFLLAAFLAPLEPRLFAAFTAHDLLILCLAAVLFVRRGGAFPHLPLNFLVFAYVFLVWALVSTLRAPYPLEALTEIAQFVFIFLVHVPTVISLARSVTLTRRSLMAILAGALAVALWAFDIHRVQGAGRVITFISKNPNRLGYPTAYLLPYLLHFALSARRVARWWVIAAVTLPCLYLFLWALAASGSRSATLATLVAVAIYLSARGGASSLLQLSVRLAAAGVATVLASFLLYSTSLLPPKLQQRIDRTLNFESSLVDDRIRLADAGLKEFSAHPWVGVGLDNFHYVAKQYNPAATDQAPHNIWIQFLAQLGIPGAFAFLGLMVLWFVVLGRAWHRAQDPVQRDLLSAFMASMAGVLAIYMLIPIMTQRQYWLLYGLGLACAQLPGEAAPGPGRQEAA